MGFLGSALRAAIGLLFGLAFMVFALSLMLAAVVVVLVLSLLALLSGRKPAPVMVFQRFRQQSQRFTGGVWTSRRATGGPAAGRAVDVVDVQAHVVPEAPAAGNEPLHRMRP
jgi:hypothetical protein